MFQTPFGGRESLLSEFVRVQEVRGGVPIDSSKGDWDNVTVAGLYRRSGKLTRFAWATPLYGT